MVVPAQMESIFLDKDNFLFDIVNFLDILFFNMLQTIILNLTPTMERK